MSGDLMPGDDAARQGRIAEILRDRGIPDAEAIAEADGRSPDGMAAGHLLVAALWRHVIEPWRSRPAWQEEWDGHAVFPELDPAAGALARLRGLGATPEGIAEVAWRVAADTVSSTLFRMTSERCDPEAPDDAPCVQLMETDSERQLTGRPVVGLEQTGRSASRARRRDRGHG